MTQHLMTRAEAISASASTYYTGKACKNGHYSARLTVDGSCSACRVDYQRQQRQQIRERLRRGSEEKPAVEV